MNINHKMLWFQKIALIEAMDTINPEGTKSYICDYINGVVSLLDHISDAEIKAGKVDELEASGYFEINEINERRLKFDWIGDFPTQNVYSFINNGDEYEVDISLYSIDELKSIVKGYDYMLVESSKGEQVLVCLSTQSELPRWVLAECILESLML